MRRPLPNSDPSLSYWEFRALLELLMVSDPWPAEDNLRCFVVELLNKEAHDRGYEDWVEAYHHI